MAKPVSKSSAPKGSRLRVLIVEHNQADVELSLKELERGGFEVGADVAGTREQAASLIAQKEYDIVLADYRLPDWTGMDALQILQQQGRNIPFILVTGTLGEERAVECIKQGATDYVLKDHLAVLPMAVRRALEARELREESERAEEALKQSEEKYRLLFERNLAGVIRTTWEGRVLDGNPALARIFRFASREDTLGRDATDFYLHPGQREKLQALLKRDGKVTDVELPMRRKDGSPVWILANITLVKEPGTGLPLVEGTVLDITGRKQAEEALKQSEEKYRLLFERNLAGVYRATRDGRILDCNEAVARIFGYDSREEVLARSTADFCPLPADRKKFMDVLEREGKLSGLEMRLRSKDGSPVWTLENATLVSGETGEPPTIEGSIIDITERKRAEEAVRQSEQNYASLMDSISGIVWECDAKTLQFSFVSKQAERLLDYPVRQWLSEPDFWRNHLDPRDRKRAVEFCFNSTRDTRDHEFEYRMVAADGRVVWLHDSVNVVVENHSAVKLRGVMVDITDRKLAEEALRRSEASLRSLVENSPYGIYRSSLGGRFVSVNPALVTMLGYDSVEEVLALDLSRDLYADTEMRSRLIQQYQRTKRVVDVEVPWKRKDGKMITVRLNGRALTNQAGEAEGFEMIAEDVTDSRRAAEALRQSEAELRSLVDNAPYGIYRASVEGRFIYVNPALVRMLGFSTAEEVLALDLAKDVYQVPEDRAKAVEILLAQPRFEGRELHWKRKDGKELVVRTAGRLVHAKGGQDYLEVIAEDITEQRLLEQQFRQAQKMEAIGQLAGGVAHDFNNLLMAMSSFTELAGQAGPTNEKQQHYLSEVLKATRRAAGLTQQLLAFSRKQVLAPSVLDLKSVVKDFGKMLPPLIGEHIEVRLLSSSQDGKVQADRGQIEQILMNLAVNARDAMPKGGTLVIEVNDVAFEQDHLGQNYTIPAGSYVLLAVSDNGSGMDAETQAHIFEPFFTTKERGKGTGLGLATVYGIVKQSGGYISAYSEPGVGTTFKLYLPRAEKPAAAPAAKPEAPAAGGSETILLVEDENAVRIATREFLETKGYKVLDAGNAAEALQAHSQHVGKVHLLITDVVMPGMSGPDLAQRLKQLDSALHVIYVSGYTDGAIASVAELQQGAGFLQKPFALDFLARRVRAILDAAAQAPAASGPEGGAR